MTLPVTNRSNARSRESRMKNVATASKSIDIGYFSSHLTFKFQGLGMKANAKKR